MNNSLNSNDATRKDLLNEAELNSISIDFLNKAELQVPNHLISKLKAKDKEERSTSIDLFTKTESNRNNSFIDPTQKGTEENHQPHQGEDKKKNNRSSSVKLNDKAKYNHIQDMSSTFVSFVTPQKKIKKVSKEEVDKTVNSMLSRFKEKQEKTDKKINELRRRAELEEISNIKSKPEIIRSPSVNFKFQNEKFIERNMKYYEMTKNKKEKLKEEIEKKKEKEDAKINPRLNKKKPPRVIKENVESILKWKEKKNEKLQVKKTKIEQTKMRDCTFKPVINDNSRKIAEAQKELKSMSSTIPTERFPDMRTNRSKNGLTSSINLKDDRTIQIRELKHNLSNLTTTTNAPNAECSSSPVRLSRSKSEIGHDQIQKEGLIKLFRQNKKLKFVSKDEIEHLTTKEASVMEEILKGKIKI